jgi:biopolymer transport protein ExbB
MRLLHDKAFRMAVGVVLLSCAAPALADEPVQKSALNMVWDVALSPPYVFFLLIACSIFTATLIIERWTFYRKATGNTEDLLQQVKRAGSPTDALGFISAAPGVAAKVMRATLQAAKDGCPADQLENVAQSASTKELIRMEQYLPQLDSMVTLCPLLGLLGTTVGMIKSFSIVAAIGMSDPTKLAGGISEALINTAAGLAVAIPALFAYNYFNGKKEAILMDLERGLTDLLLILKAPHH